MKSLKTHLGLSVFLLSQLTVSIALADVAVEPLPQRTKSPLDISLLGGKKRLDDVAPKAEAKSAPSATAQPDSNGFLTPKAVKAASNGGAKNTEAQNKEAKGKEAKGKEAVRVSKPAVVSSSKNEASKPASPMNPAHIEKHVTHADPNVNKPAPRVHASKTHTARRHTVTGQISPASLYPDVMVKPNEKICLSDVEGIFTNHTLPSKGPSPLALMSVAHRSEDDIVEKTADAEMITKVFSVGIAIYPPNVSDYENQTPACTIAAQVAGDVCSFGSALRVNLPQGCQIRVYRDSTQKLMRVRYNEACLTNLCDSQIKWQDLYFDSRSER